MLFFLSIHRHLPLMPLLWGLLVILHFFYKTIIFQPAVMMNGYSCRMKGNLYSLHWLHTFILTPFTASA